jgi:hypothetical protein
MTDLFVGFELGEGMIENNRKIGELTKIVFCVNSIWHFEETLIFLRTYIVASIVIEKNPYFLLKKLLITNRNLGLILEGITSYSFLYISRCYNEDHKAPLYAIVSHCFRPQYQSEIEKQTEQTVVSGDI